MAKKKGKKGGGQSAKAAKKATMKKLEDRTFGMKNKKGGKAKKLMAQMQAQINHKFNPKGRNAPEMSASEKRKAKLLKAKEDALMNNLFAVSKADKEKAAKKKAKLEELKKQGKAGVEKKKKKKKPKKGAPNFKTVKKEVVDNRPKEVIIEEKRAALYAKGGNNLTPVTAETFAKWKKKIAARKKKKDDAARKAYEKEYGRKLAKTGRELYALHSKNFVEEAGAGDSSTYAGGKRGVLEAEEEDKKATTGQTPVPPIPPNSKEGASSGAIDKTLYMQENLDDLADLEGLDLSDDE
eukprot:g513.t1